MSENMSKKLTLYSFLMTIGIVFYHYSWLPTNYHVVANTYFTNVFYRFFTNYFDSLGYLSLGYFFMASGFLLYYGADKTSIWHKIKRRFYSLGIPYLLWNGIVAVFILIFERRNPIISIQGLIWNLTVEPLNGPFWYIFMLMVLMLLAPLVVRLKQKKWLAILLFGVVCVVAYAISARGAITSLTMWDYYGYLERFIRYLPAYFLGALCGMHFSDVILEEKYNKRYLFWGATILYIASTVYLCLLYEQNSIVEWLILRIQPILVWFMIDSAWLKRKMPFPFKISFFIYATHLSIIVPILHWLFYERLSQYVWTGVTIVLLRVVAVICIYFINLILVYVCKHTLQPWLYAALSGNRT